MTLPLACQWQNVGTLLDPELPEGTLGSIKVEYLNQPNNCLRATLECWLKQTDPHPSWSALAIAIEPFDPYMAENIRKKYCVHS